MGIDPGSSSGCIVVLDENGQFVGNIRFANSTLKQVNDFVRDAAWEFDLNCLVEQVNVMPGEGVSSAFTFGKNNGFIEGILIAHGIPYETKIPRSWQKLFGIQARFKSKKGETGTEETKTEFKRRVRGYAERLFPNVKITNDVADALLIAEACRKLTIK